MVKSPEYYCLPVLIHTVGYLRQLIAIRNNVNLATGTLGLKQIHFAATFGYI